MLYYPYLSEEHKKQLAMKSKTNQVDDQVTKDCRYLFDSTGQSSAERYVSLHL